jgi:hypothetical protein
MNEPLDNSVSADRSSRRGNLLQSEEGPQALARRMAQARDREGTLRPTVQFVAHPDGTDHTGPLRALLTEGRLGDALALCVECLGPRYRDEHIRRVVFALLRRPVWRRRLMPLLRQEVVARNLNPVLGGLYLYGLLQAGKMPRMGVTSPLLWAYAIVWLLDHCEPEDARALARHIADQYPRITFLEQVASGLEQVPPRLPHDDFRDHWSADIQLARSSDPSCSRLLICFAGMFGRMGTPIGTFHRWASRTDAHIVYLKDLRRNFYRTGIASLTREAGGKVEDMHVFLRSLADELGATRTGIYGISMGGIPAVETALAIGADRVVWAAGAVERDDRETPYDDPSEAARRRQRAEELLARISDSASPPEIACVYGEGFPTDAEMPLILDAHPCVSLHPLEGLSDHNIDFHLVKAGRFEPLVNWAACNGKRLELS